MDILILKLYKSDEPDTASYAQDQQRTKKLEPLGLSDSGEILFKFTDTSLENINIAQSFGFNLKKYLGHIKTNPSVNKLFQ